MRDRQLDGPRDSQGLRGFKAQMIDQGHTFSGESWEFRNAPAQGLYSRKVVYKKVTSLIDFEPSLDRLIEIPHSVLMEASDNIPPGWIEGDHGALELLLDKLWNRRTGVAALIEDCNRSQPGLFPSWRGGIRRSQTGLKKGRTGRGETQTIAKLAWPECSRTKKSPTCKEFAIQPLPI